MTKTVEVLLSRRVTVGSGEKAGDYDAGTKIHVSEEIAASIVAQNAGLVLEEKVLSKAEVKAAEKAAAEAEAAAKTIT